MLTNKYKNDEIEFIQAISSANIYNLENNCVELFTEYMHLDIFIREDDNELKNKYLEAAKQHNEKIIKDPFFYDAGFDLFIPFLEHTNTNTRQFFSLCVNKVDFKISCCATLNRVINKETISFKYTPFYTYARSSISKTKLRLVNNQGIIDAGYRGPLIGMFSCEEGVEELEFYSRLLQICAPNLLPIYVNVVDSVQELGPSTSRGEGGFGSTGV